MIQLKKTQRRQTRATDAGGMMAQIAAHITVNRFNNKPEISSGTTDTYLQDADAEYADMYHSRAKQNTNSASDNASDGGSAVQKDNESDIGWMKSINDLQESLLGVRKESAEDTNIAMPPIDESASRDGSDESDLDRRDKLKRSSSLGSRWKRSFHRLASAGRKEEEDMDDNNSSASMAEQSVEVNLTSRSVASNKSAAKKRFPFSSNLFRTSKTAPQQQQQPEYVETVTVHSGSTSRDFRKPPKLPVFSVGGIQQDMESLSMGGIHHRAGNIPDTKTEADRSLRGKSRSRSPARFLRASRGSRSNSSKSQGGSTGPSSRASTGYASSDKSSSTRKTANHGRSPGGFFRKRPHRWLVNSNKGTKSDSYGAAVSTADSRNSQKKFKNAKGESIASCRNDEGGGYSIFPWDNMNGAPPGNSTSPEQSSTTWISPGATSPFNPSFLENSLFVSSAATTKRSIQEENKLQRGGSFGKHFLLNSLDADQQSQEDTTDSQEDDALDYHTCSDDDDDYSGSSGDGDNDLLGDGHDDENDSMGSHSRESFSPGIDSGKGRLVTDDQATGKGKRTKLAASWLPSNPSWFRNDNDTPLTTVFSDKSLQFATAGALPSTSSATKNPEEFVDWKVPSSPGTNSTANDKKSSHRRMRSLGSLVGKPHGQKSHRRKSSMGSIGNKSEGHRRKASLGSIGGFLRRKISRKKSVSGSASCNTVTELSNAEPQISAAETMPEKVDSAYLTKQLQKKAIEAMQNAQTSKMTKKSDATDFATLDSRNPSDTYQLENAQRNVPLPILAGSADWRSEYRAFLSSANSGIAAGKSVGGSALKKPTSASGRHSSYHSNITDTFNEHRTQPMRRRATNETPGAGEILEDLEQSSSWLIPTSGQSLPSDDNPFQPSTVTAGTGPVVSESTVENNDSSNVYLVRVQF
jgi:hypothetical protein